MNLMRACRSGGRRGLLGLFCLCLSISACAPKKTVRKPARSGAEGSLDLEGSPVRAVPEVDVDEARIRGKEFADTQDLDPVRFGYDSYLLDEGARVTLKRNTEFLRSHPDLEILIEGHCDERGTIEYNLALGQKRAKEARDYYIRLGISGRSLGTISFGEEAPACEESTEECWAQNRRAQTKVRARTASNGLPPRP
ncbi:MAG: OmpA family protein [Elusimicrobiota bacterium]